jgi:hypothetical protein
MELKVSLGPIKQQSLDVLRRSGVPVQTVAIGFEQHKSTAFAGT